MFGMLKATEVLGGDESVVRETSNAYDYRGRRISHIENEDETQYSYGDGVSVLETKGAKTTLTYRGSDQGGGVGGTNYAEYSDGSELNYKIYNLRGDVIKTVDANKQTKSFSNYYAFGEYKDVIGKIKTDDYRANTKVEDDHDLLNEGKRFRQLEYGIFLTPDPLEYVDGYNPYIYCGQNPWGKWDPLGLAELDVGSSSNIEKKEFVVSAELKEQSYNSDFSATSQFRLWDAAKAPELLNQNDRLRLIENGDFSTLGPWGTDPVASVSFGMNFEARGINIANTSNDIKLNVLASADTGGNLNTKVTAGLEHSFGVANIGLSASNNGSCSVSLMNTINIDSNNSFNVGAILGNDKPNGNYIETVLGFNHGETSVNLKLNQSENKGFGVFINLEKNFDFDDLENIFK